MAKRKPKMIPLKELRALCKEAGVEIAPLSDLWHIWRSDEDFVMDMYKDEYIDRQSLKAFCLGLIAMRKDGEL